MLDILQIVEKLRARSYLLGSDKGPRLDAESLAHFHAEAQTYLLAEILQELRKQNRPLLPSYEG
jgi:hypothetical protein